MKLKIKVTKEILERSKNCKYNGKSDKTGTGANCAVALAVIDVFPDAWVNADSICPFFFNSFSKLIPLPYNARYFIYEFDKATAEERAKMREEEFELGVPDWVIERINIDEIKPLLENHPTLELITT